MPHRRKVFCRCNRIFNFGSAPSALRRRQSRLSKNSWRQAVTHNIGRRLKYDRLAIISLDLLPLPADKAAPSAFWLRVDCGGAAIIRTCQTAASVNKKVTRRRIPARWLPQSNAECPRRNRPAQSIRRPPNQRDGRVHILSDFICSRLTRLQMAR